MKTGLIGIAVILLLMVGSADAALLTFDDAISGATSYSFDGDGDTIYDVIFTTTDPYGFNTAGPGSYMTYIQEPGLEGTSLLSPDLRVDFLVGAVGTITFGFALDSWTEDDTATFRVYDSSDNLLVQTTVTGLYTYPDTVNPSNYPEGEISVSFAGVAAYATFDFTSDLGRYIIDNFEGTFGSTEVVSANLIADGGSSLTAFDVGEVAITNDGTNLVVTFSLDLAPWGLWETHLHIGDAVADIPQTKKGNAVPGKFDYDDSDAVVSPTEHVYTIPLADLVLAAGDDIVVAAHAAIAYVDDMGTPDPLDDILYEETAWGEGPEISEGRDWAMYIEAEVPEGPVAP